MAECVTLEENAKEVLERNHLKKETVHIDYPLHSTPYLVIFYIAQKDTKHQHKLVIIPYHDLYKRESIYLDVYPVL